MAIGGGVSPFVLLGNVPDLGPAVCSPTFGGVCSCGSYLSL